MPSIKLKAFVIATKLTIVKKNPKIPRDKFKPLNLKLVILRPELIIIEIEII